MLCSGQLSLHTTGAMVYLQGSLRVQESIMLHGTIICNQSINLYLSNKTI